MEHSPDAWTRACSRCGAPNPEQANFCMMCAQSLTGAAPALVRDVAVAGAVSATARSTDADASETHVSTGAFSAHGPRARVARRGAGATATLTPPPIPPDAASATVAQADATSTLPASLDDRTVALPPAVEARNGAAPAASEDRTVMFEPDLQVPAASDDRTVLLDRGVETATGIAPGAASVSAPDDRTVMLDAGVHTPGAGTPAAPDDRTVLFQPGTQPPPGATPARSFVRSGGLSRTAARSGMSRPGTPFGSRMSVLSSLADADSPAPLAEGLEIADRYRVKSLIGKGGMGVVYLVDDLELDREIALKVIRSDIAASPESLERFKREIQLSSKVTHPNVLRVYDLGESEGVKFLTMQYVQGEDLSNIVKRDGRLPFDRVLNYFKQICAGLGVAHEQGVIHRDLKPQNVMIDPTDRVLLTDFGLATVAEGSSAAKSGAIMGTPYYMSPEQVRGEELDQRSDIYALGIMLYELLTGAIPFVGGTVIDVMKRRLTEKPRPIGELNPDLPAYIRRIVEKCLATDRDQRYASCGEILEDIYDATEGRLRRRHAAALLSFSILLVLGAVGASGWYVYQQKQAELARNRPPVSVLVADFVDKTNTPLFKGTLENALTTGMEGASFITAFSRASARQIADEQIAPGAPLDVSAARLISAREGIKIVLAGSVERDGDGYSLTVDAIDPAVNKVLSSANATAASQERILSAVGVAAAKIRGALGDRTSDKARLVSESVTASSLAALQAYTRAQELADANRNQEALAAYQETVRLDPNFGRAYAGMGVIYSIAKDDARAKAAYDEALKRIDRMSEREKLRTLGTYYMMVARNYEKAIENYQMLVKLYPADDGAHGNLGLAYLYTGDIQRAKTEASAVLKIYPSQWAQRYNYAMYSMYAGDFATSETEARRVLTQASTFELAFVPIALSSLIQGDLTGARATYDQLAKLSVAGSSLAQYGRADLEMFRGRTRQALPILQSAITSQLEEDAGAGTLAHHYLAYAEASLALGQTPRAVDAARRAIGLSAHESVLFPASLVFIASGQRDDAEKVATTLENMLQTHTIAYARLIDAQLAVSRGRFGQAIELFRDSIKRRDTWFARFLLGKLYAETEHFTEAMAELDLCIKRRGEALDAFFYDTPTARYLPPAYYWLARAQQALGVADAKGNYETYVTMRTAADPPDPLVEDARRRMAN